MTTSNEEMLAAYLKAEAAVLQGRIVVMNGRELTREDLKEIRAGRQEWENKVNQAAGMSGTTPKLVNFNHGTDSSGDGRLDFCDYE